MCNKEIVNKGCGMHTKVWYFQVFVVLQEMSTFSKIVHITKTVIKPSTPFASLCKKGTTALVMELCFVDIVAYSWIVHLMTEHT